MTSSTYEAGFKAFQNGSCISTNPFVRNSKSYSTENSWFQWRRGFFNAREELYDSILVLEENLRIEMNELYKLRKKAAGNSDGVQG